MASSEGGAQITAKDINTYFYEDEVYTVDKRGRVKFGVIVSSGTISDEDDDDYVDPGKVRVTWHPDGKEAVLPVNQVSHIHFNAFNLLTSSCLPSRSAWSIAHWLPGTWSVDWTPTANRNNSDTARR